MVTSDPDMSKYLHVFMNVVTGAYRTSEAIKQERFQFSVKEGSFVVQGSKAALCLVPFAGSFLKSSADVIHSKIQNFEQKQWAE